QQPRRSARMMPRGNVNVNISQNPVGFKGDNFISSGYRELQRELHARPNGYGGKGDKWAAGVLAVAAAYDASSILDYGCGEGTLAKALAAAGRVCREYDPAVAGKDSRPAFADL